MKDKKFVHSAFCVLHSALVSLALAGCEGGYGAKQQGDPFMGIGSGPKPVSSAGGGASATQTATNTPPPLPASISVPNQAALAGGTTQTQDDPRSLRIATPPPVVPVSSPGGAVRGVAPSNVQVEGPVPVPESTSKSMPGPIASAGTRPTGGAVAPPPPGAAMTFEQIQQQLKQRGVVWQRLDLDQGQWKFQCSLPIPGNKGMNRVFATDAPLPSDSLAAMRAVLDKIEKEQQ